MPTVRKKLNKSAILLLAFLAVGAITVVVLHFVGIVNLSFLGDFAISIANWAAQSGWNAAIVSIGIFAAGMGITLWLKDYIIGTSLPPGTVAPGTYVPPGQTLSQQPQNSDTVISA